MSFSELEVGADDRTVLDQIIGSLNSLASANEDSGDSDKNENKFSMKFGKVSESVTDKGEDLADRPAVLILGAGRVCRPAAEFLAASGSILSSQSFKTCLGNDDTDEPKDVQVILASLYLKDAQEVDVVISLLPPSCHITIVNACIELKKNLVTASYVDDSMSKLNEKARNSGITILGEMGLDPGIDHMMEMKMINQAHSRKGIIKSFTSYCGGLPSPEAANNPLGYKFSWNPAGAIRAGRNPATYKYHGETMHVDGDKLNDSATRFRIPDLPAFALECLPNRNSLVYGDFYGIGDEASTIFRGTLRYEGFGEIMACLAKIGFFNTEPHPALKEKKTLTFGTFLDELLKVNSENPGETVRDENEMIERLITLRACKERACAAKTVKTISAFDITCLRMEERLAYVDTEQDMVLLHHEVEIEFPDGRPTEKHQASLLEFGRIKNGKTTTAMAVTVGMPAAIGALLLLQNKIKTKGVLRPLEPEVYMPALDILEAYGFKLSEKME
ncbi:hypothetical protein MKX01_041309 [Papaver californicum]|nr:hypothetical protein MKX01_041309 [Papaver californicum]